MPSESPTRMTSMPASATRRANAASYAVIIVMRLPSRFMATRSGTVTFLRDGVLAPPYCSLIYDLRPGRLRAGPGVRSIVPRRPSARFIPACWSGGGELVDQIGKCPQVADDTRRRRLEGLAVAIDEDGAESERGRGAHVVVLARAYVDRAVLGRTGPLEELTPVASYGLVAAAVLRRYGEVWPDAERCNRTLEQIAVNVRQDRELPPALAK